MYDFDDVIVNKDKDKNPGDHNAVFYNKKYTPRNCKAWYEDKCNEENCALWAHRDECDKSPEFMYAMCPEHCLPFPFHYTQDC